MSGPTWVERVYFYSLVAALVLGGLMFAAALDAQVATNRFGDAAPSSSTTVPATCSVGEWYHDTDARRGSRVC